MSAWVIERLASPVADRDIEQLAELLIDAIDSGAGVSFMPPLPKRTAAQWWSETIGCASDRAIFLVARDETGICGTVQMQPAWPPNQPHRGDIAKMIVHRRARGRGIARALMARVEQFAAEEGFTLLTLDTVRGSAAERLYRSLRWVEVGVIPDYALNPDGSLIDTVVFYKRIGQELE